MTKPVTINYLFHGGCDRQTQQGTNTATRQRPSIHVHKKPTGLHNYVYITRCVELRYLLLGMQYEVQMALNKRH